MKKRHEKSEIPDFENANFRHIVSCIDLVILEKWTSVVLAQMDKEEKQKKKSTGFSFFGMFGSKQES